MPGPCVGRVGLGLLADCGSRLALRPDVDTSAEQRISAEKRSAVSTGQLRRLLALHTRPIYPVVFREPSSHKGKGDLILQRVSRLDAFSVYPGRTLATQRCRERDNWHTRGSSLSILSY